jgi:DHA2 family multidrug resistance protein
VGSLQTVLEEGNSELWFDSPFIILMSILSAVGLITFIHRQLNSPRPVVDLRVLRYRSLWSGSILSIVLGASLYGAVFAVPIFAQSLLGYSSQQTGFMLLPSALASAVMMPIASGLTKKYDSRVLFAAGALVMVAAMLWLGHLSPQTGESNLFAPLILRSFGTVLMYMPLSMAALGPIPKEDITKATGFFSLTRQLGGSIGVAVLSTLLERREAFHRAVLVEKLVNIDPNVLERVRLYAARFLNLGFSPDQALARAYKLLDVTVNTQAAVISFGDCFWATSMLVLFTLPLVLLLGKPATGATVDAGH